MSSGLVNAWDLQDNDVIVELNNQGGTHDVRRYRVIGIPKVNWPNAATAVRCQDSAGLLTSFLFDHSEKVFVIRQTDNHSRRAWTRRKELQS